MVGNISMQFEIVDSLKGHILNLDLDDNCVNSTLYWKDNSLKEDFIINLIFAFISSCFIPFLMYVGYRVFRMTKWNEKIILLMILCLNLELIDRVLFYLLNAQQDLENRCK